MVYPGRRGCPDRFFFKAGRLVIIEFKRPGIRSARAQQRREHRRYADAGWEIHIVNDRATAKAILMAVAP
jgi:hypothetical protein